MLKEKITVGEAVNLINDSIIDFQDGLSSETINKIIYSINNEIQIRDYLMGLPNVFDMETCKAFLFYISDSVDISERYSVDSVNSAYHYETEDMEVSSVLLGRTLIANPTYPLAQLLKRVFEANWASDAFATMRKELHDNVVAGLEEMKEVII